MLLIGLDAATKPEKVGFACGHLRNGVVQIDRAGLLKNADDPDSLAAIIIPALMSARDAVVAIDAPLGWPTDMGPILGQHQAGDVINASPRNLFQRHTDRHINDSVGKHPLEVGADRIARTAHAALQLLHTLRQETGKAIPLAWSPAIQGAAVIEVYPAATLIGWHCESTGYKKMSNAGVRMRIARQVGEVLPGLERWVNRPVDVFDALLCVLAAKDFLDGKAPPPPNQALAMKEGWIWAKPPQ